jgi:hypothetical protein
MFTRPVSLVLFLVIVLTVLSQVPAWRRLTRRIRDAIFPRRKRGDDGADGGASGGAAAGEGLEEAGKVTTEESASDSVKRKAKE